MALFESLSLSHLPALLRQGFGARLRSETADIFLTQRDDNTLMTTDKRDNASIFFFVTSDPPLTVVLVRKPEASQAKYLSLTETPALVTEPCLLKLKLVNSRRGLFSISYPAPPRQLSLHHIQSRKTASLRSENSKWEQFHLEILPRTIGSGIIDTSLVASPHVSLSQALTHAFLRLSSRFRLRSVHSRVLSEDSRLCVHNDVPKTSVASSTSSDLLLVSYHSTQPAKDASCAHYTIRHAIAEKQLKLTPSPRFVSESDILILIRASPNGYGTVSLSPPSPKPAWLMAGKSGKLESRPRPGAWETFTIELVRQSYEATLREIPPSVLFKTAEAAMRAALHAKVASAKKGATAKPAVASKSTSGFNHAKALSGFSDEVKPSSSPSSTAPTSASSSGTGASQKKKKKKGQQNGAAAAKAVAAAAKAVAAAAPAAGMPRNKLSKKAAKRARKKAAKAAKTVGSASSASASGASSSSASNTITEKKPATEPKDKKSDAIEQGSSSAPATSPSGPPCAACGRPLAGNYVKAMGKEFHPHCFCCGLCRRPLGVGASQFRERGGIPYCNACYASNLASRCARCSKPILETVVTAMDKTWHKECLTCTICRLPLTQTFWLYADRPNEPRCSRCVAGDENYRSNRSSGRMVNLPFIGGGSVGSNAGPSLPLNGPTNFNGVVGGGIGTGRARMLNTPLLPTTRR